ncbi:hypothetical protein MBLNU13_g07152t1 [Cladosporium sp. NU13]
MAGKKSAGPKLVRAKKKQKPKPLAASSTSADLVIPSTRLDALYHAVLDTTELLECVLSHLPSKQIFGVQRLARLWKDVIARSPAIQEKLFLKLQNKPAELWGLLECARRAEFEGSRLRLEKPTSEAEVESVSTTDVGMFTSVALNPFLQVGEDPDEGPLCKQHEYDENDEILELHSLADIIAEWEIKHECRAVFKPDHTVIYLDNNGETSTGHFSLVPTKSDRRDVVDHDNDIFSASEGHLLSDYSHKQLRENVKQDAQTAVGPQAEHDSTCSESRDKVFDTSEIIEGILECLPAKTLFVVRRVNKRFHETIADLPRIQRKMFLRIDNDHSVTGLEVVFRPSASNFQAMGVVVPTDKVKAAANSIESEE